MTTPARVLGFLLATVTTLVLGASAASADAPVGPAWPEGPGRSALETLIFFGGGTLAVIAVVALLGLLTARNNYVPPPPSTDLEPRSK